MVTIVQPVFLRSFNVAMTSGSVSPNPTIRPDFIFIKFLDNI